MTDLAGSGLAAVGIDAAALKPSEMDVQCATALDVDVVTIDYEGRDHVPTKAEIDAVAATAEVRVTVPVRVDGFDPLGEDHLWQSLPDGVGHVLVAGHPAYLTAAERERALAPRLTRATERCPDPWIGTEGVERLALVLGATQFELLAADTEGTVSRLRTAGFAGDIAVYAPTVLTDDADRVLDAVGAYVARRKSVRDALPPDVPRDHRITGSARETLLDACREYALVGDASAVSDRVSSLHEAGVDHVVGYPARGLSAVL